MINTNMAQFDDQKYHRRSIRLNGYYYTRPGAYFVTLVTQGRECLFGEVEEGGMQLNPFGRLADNEWRRLEERFGNIVVDEWILMPNHLHGILVICAQDSMQKGRRGEAREEEDDRERPNAGALERSPNPPLPRPFKVTSFKDNSSEFIVAHGATPVALGTIIGAYKSTTTRLINGLRRCPGEPVWQRNYYEHIIRNEDEWEAIRKYIHDNPARWELDRENPYRERETE